ncbi:hypothetical protein FA13DRAFT_1728638 [Coprinellus micaceus]|uniref:Yeast cell wall synthesis Kre9/Knh1-like N-terminal domain-containing protein n=1 Tax=Coprinellus micaceus TaxID=71717 RepID=A0A4Y7TNK0_COPMI|nr:hypothetical protein FA13DRAFT_1728638 [Coprinellus micaceus]
MHAATLVFLSVLSTAFGFQVTRPSLSQGWTNNGPQTVAWDRVATDASNFSIVLTNLDRSVLSTDIVLADFVDATSASSISVSQPSSGWPTTGGSYRVNLVKSKNEQTTIYAQSTEFNITAGAATESAKSTSATSSSAGTASRSQSTATGSSTDSADGSASTDSSMSSPLTTGNSASGNFALSAGVVTAAVAMIGSVLL